MNYPRRFVLTAIAVCMSALTAAPLIAGEVTMRIMPAPDTPEADFTPEKGTGWDVSAGYGNIWFENQYISGSLNGAAAGVVYRGVLGNRFGYTISPLMGGVFFGESSGYSADTWSAGTGFTFASRILGRKESHNLILFAGGVATFSSDSNEISTGDYSLDAGFYGFNTGVKLQLVPRRFVIFRPFYLYMGGGGHYRSTVSSALPTITMSGTLGYQDVHLFGLDFSVYGISAKIIGDFLRPDSGSITIMVNILGTVRGVKKAGEQWKGGGVPVAGGEES